MELEPQTLVEWLLMPPEMKFSIFDRDDGASYPSFRQLWVCVPLAILITIVRLVIVEG